MVKKMNIIDYISLVDEIVDAHYVNGVYAPHYGRVTLKKIFYNNLYKNADEPEIETAEELDFMLANSESFETVYTNELAVYGQELCFGNALEDAKKIIESKNQSVNMLIDAVERVVNNVVSTVANSLNGEDLKKLTEIMSCYSPKEVFSEEKLAEAYMKQKEFVKEK